MSTTSPIEADGRKSVLAEKTALTARNIFWLLLGLSLAVQALIYGVVTTKPVIRSDGAGYYLYLPAAIVHGDLSLATMERQEFPGGIPAWTGAHRVAGQYVIKYPLGEALMQTPFFLLARLTAAALGRTSVFDWPYQWGTAMAGAFYFALGGCFTWILLRDRFDRSIATIALLLTVCGTNLLHYATYDAGFSHVYSFCLAAGLLLASSRLAGSAAGHIWIGAGLIGGLIVVTRPTNAVFFLFLAGDWLAHAGSCGAGLTRLREKWPQVCLAVLAGAVPVGLQMAYWKSTSGQWILYSYGGEGFNFAKPAMREVLFSIERGWLVYLPLVFVAGLGWLAARDRLTNLFPTLLFFSATNLWLVASWHDWGYGASFSMRPFVESSPLVALGLAGGLWRCQDHPRGMRVLLIFSAGCAIYSSLLMLGYWRHTLPYTHATWTDIQNCLTLDWLGK